MKRWASATAFVILLNTALDTIFASAGRSAAAVEFVPAAVPTGLAVSAVVWNETRRLLQLNITWTPNSSSEGAAKGYNLHVWPLNDSDPHCETEPYYGFLQDSKSSNWAVPPKPLSEDAHDINSLSVIPECSYRIRLEANPHDGKTYLQTDYTVPDCVEGVCSCRHAESLPRPELRLDHMSQQAVNITWCLPDLHNISSFLLRAGPRVVEGTHSAVYNLSWSRVVPVGPRQLVYHQLYPVTATGRHAVTLSALDHRQCAGPDQKLLFSIGDGTSEKNNSLNEVFWTTLFPIGLLLLALCLLAIFFGQKCFFWFENKRKNTQIVSQAYFYKAINIKSEKVFRRSDSLQERNVLYVEKEIEEAKARGLVDCYEISYNRLTLEREIGHGAFGQVFLAKAEAIRGVPGTQLVAVKKLKAKVGAEEKDEFLEEIWMLKKAGQHPNIVSLLACCTLQSNLCMVMEYVPCGDLLQYLRNLRLQLDARKPSVTSMSDGMYSGSSTVITSVYSQTSTTQQLGGQCQLEYVLDHRELHKFARQIASGMAHLEAKRITHRDLAARNILIDHNKVLKISDFGLSRRGVYVNTRRRKVPLRWLSIEAMRDSLYSSKSDVWAFAILLWEIGTLGGFPYPTVADQDLLNYLKSGERLEKPDIVSDSLYSVMLVCWSERPDDRLSFAQLVAYLEPDPERHIYVNFGSNPSFPPMSPRCPPHRHSTMFFK